MNYKNLVLDERGDVSTIGFTSRTNKITPDILNELQDALTKAQGDVIILRAKENFSTGYDLRALASLDRQGFYRLAELGQAVCSLLDSSSKITMAALTGYTLGPGLEIALACDFRIAADTAVLGFPEIRFGLLPSFGTMHRLPSLIGHSKSKKLLLGGSTIHTEDAHRLGLIDEVVENPVARAQEIASSVSHAPSAALEAKRLLSQASLAEERNAFAACCTEETKKRLEAYLKQAAKKL